MTVGLLCYLWKQEAYLGDIGRKPARPQSAEKTPLARSEKRRLAVIGLQGMFTVVYAAAFYQKGGLLTLFARDYLNRDFFGFEIPITWLLIISTSTFALLAPASGKLWVWLDKRGRNPSAPKKLLGALGLMAVAYVFMGFAGLQAQATGHASILWMVIVYLMFGLGDLLVWPIQISMVSQLAPTRYKPLYIGGWYLTVGLGTWLTGVIAVAVGDMSLSRAFFSIAFMMLVSASVLCAVLPLLQRLSRGDA